MIAIYSASRLVTTGILMSFAARQEANAWTAARPGYGDFARLWDGHWYYIIAVSGYPDAIPRDASGLALENAFAFMPVYPFLVRTIMLASGLDFATAAVTVSAVAGGAAALLFHRLMRVWLARGAALLATTLFCVAPLSPIYQVAYAESLQLVLLLAALLLLIERWFVPLAFVVTAMALTRPSGLAFALALALYAVWRWSRRAIDPFPPRERLTVVVVTAVAGGAGLAWPGIVALLTGDLTGYTDTELAWRRPYIGAVELVPFAPWWQGAQWLFGEVLGPVILIGALALCAAAFALPAMRRMPVELRCWIVAYAVYLLAVFFPQSSTFRLLVPLAPVLGAVAAGALSPRWPRGVRIALAVALVVASVAAQAGWVHIAWWVDGYDWTPP